MDNFSQDAEKEIYEQNSEAKNIEDIEFEEVLGDEKSPETIKEEPIQEENIQEKFEENEDDLIFDELSDDELSKHLKEGLSELSIPGIDEETETVSEKIDKNAKKYVIYIDSDNIDFIESLSMDERRDVINRILKEQNEFIQKRKKREAREMLVKNVLIMVLTFIVSFPIIFFVVNKSTELTVLNYKRAKDNFSKLYREEGKIKPNVSNTMKQIKY